MKSVIICDMEGVIQEMNQGALNLFGYNKDELIGKKRVSIFSPGEIVIQNVLGWLKKANKDGKASVRTKFLKKDGSEFNAEIIITPNFANGKDKGQTGYCGITKEIKDNVDIPISYLTKFIKGIAITRGGFTLASILPMIVVSCFLAASGNLNLLNSIISVFGVACLHLFSNLYNDYYDVNYGTDDANSEYFNVGDKSFVLRGAQISGGSRAIELGLTTLSKTKSLANLMLFLSIISLVFVCINSYIITASLINLYGMIAIALIAILLGYFYTAKPLRLAGRKGLGEITIFLAFGPLLTLGSAFAMSSLSYDYTFESLSSFLLLGCPLGLLTTNILFINQFPDYASDKKTGKINLVVLLGKKNSRWIYLFNTILIILLTFLVSESFFKSIDGFNKDVFNIILTLLAIYGFYISVGLFRKYKSRDLIKYNIQTIYYQIFFCFALILSLTLFLK